MWDYDKNDLVRNGEYLFAKVRNHPKCEILIVLLVSPWVRQH